MNGLNDPQALSLFQQGDQGIFDQVFREMENDIYRKAYTMLDHTAEAEDVVAIVRKKFWNKKAEIIGTANAKGFLWLTTRNTCVDMLRQRKKLSIQLGPYEHLPEPSNPGDLEAQARLNIDEGMIKLAMDLLLEEKTVLSAREQDVADRRLLKNHSFEQIANDLEINISTVRTHWNNARNKMKAALKDLFS